MNTAYDFPEPDLCACEYMECRCVVEVDYNGMVCSDCQVGDHAWSDTDLDHDFLVD